MASFRSKKTPKHRQYKLIDHSLRYGLGMIFPLVFVSNKIEQVLWLPVVPLKGVLCPAPVLNMNHETISILFNLV